MNSLAQRPKLIILFCSASGISVRPPLATVLSAAASVHLFLSHAAKGGSFGPFDDDVCFSNGEHLGEKSVAFPILRLREPRARFFAVFGGFSRFLVVLYVRPPCTT